MAGQSKTVPRCGARTRKGTPCKCKALPNGRCKHHGGLSTGPRTVAGKEAAKRNLIAARAALADPRYAELRSKAARKGWTTRRLNTMKRTLAQMAAEGDPLAAELLDGM